MLFNSFTFLFFFLLFGIAYYLLRGHLRFQNTLLLIGSYIFYGWWDERFLVLIMVSTVTDYVTGLGIADERLSLRQGLKLSAFLLLGSLLVCVPNLTQNQWILGLLLSFILLCWLTYLLLIGLKAQQRRKAFLTASIFINLGLLALFKYFNFFADSLKQAISIFGWEVDMVTLNIILPVGISFYTFQSMSYSLDIYKGKIQPTNQFLEFAAFVAFFPQLVAGPIERASHLLPQFFTKRSPTYSLIYSGVWLFIWGLYKKLVIADNLSPIADPIFANPTAAAQMELIAAILAFTFQIYCDFSGYSDMARGIARILGFQVMVNFNLPYIARTPSEFWHRWHISLSTWLRDYLYIPLGGNRQGKGMTYRNLMITMLLGGLWHGASWTFVVWGGYHGLILISYRLLNVDSWCANLNARGLYGYIINVMMVGFMFTLVCFGWLLFRAESLEVVGSFISGIINGADGSNPISNVLFYVIPLLVFQSLQIGYKNLEPLPKMPSFIRLNIHLFIIFSLLSLAATGGQQFIYFDF